MRASLSIPEGGRTMKDEKNACKSLPKRIEIIYRDEKKKLFPVADENFLNLIKEGFEAGNLGYVLIDCETGSLHMEFGDKYCNIQMDNEENGEIYCFLNPREPDTENFVDLWVNSYPRNMLCRNIEDALNIIRAFAVNGEPNPAFTWDVIDM
jgi:hypothetical protein